MLAGVWLAGFGGGGSVVQAADNYVPGQLIVQFVPDFDLQAMSGPENAPDSLRPFFSQLGVKSLKPLGGKSNVFLLNMSAAVSEALKLAESEKLVKRAEPNRVVQLQQAAAKVPVNDPLYLDGKQWWLDKIQAPLAWNITTGSPDILVGVVDSGIDATHPDLLGHVVNGYNFREEKREVIDRDGHGTAVASCIGANSNDGQGMAGINWNVRFINTKAGEASLYFFDVARAIIFAADNGARVINGSYGGGFAAFAEEIAIEYAQSKNVVMVFSSGNDGSSAVRYPAGLPGVISVGASDINDRIVDFSSYGPNTSLVAPGAGIWMAKTGGGYVSENGTSFSAPMVTGVVSLMLSVNPNLTPAQVKTILEGTSDDITGQGFTDKAGWGRLNAFKAVQAVKNGDFTPNKRSSISGKVSGVDPAKVRLSLDPLGITLRPTSDGSFKIPNLGKANYRLRAVVSGSGTGQGVKELKLSGQDGDNQTVNFAFQEQSSVGSLTDLARSFDALSSEAGASARAAGKVWFDQTGHSLDGAFRRYWEKQGGLAVFGFPLSEPFLELSATDGKLYTVQYFERNRFELHPENAGTNYEVLLGLLGREQTSGRNFPPGTPSNGGQYFAETGYTLDNRFLNYWQSKGGLALFGLPISEAFSENGQIIQYFERNRFELHPENTGTQYQVLLGLLGRDLARQRNYL